MESPVGENGTNGHLTPEKQREGRMSASRYLATRLSTLKPPMHPVPNPFKLLTLLNTQQWLFFLIGFLGWTVHDIDPGVERRS